jgi:hypothetical protein
MNHTHYNAFAETEQLTKSQHAYALSVAEVADPWSYNNQERSVIRNVLQGCFHSGSIIDNIHSNGTAWQRHDNLSLRQIFDNDNTKSISYNQTSPFLA